MAGGKARLPPRWFVVTFWHVHRWIVRATGRRKGLWPPRPGKWGALRLTTVGRRSGRPRSVIVGYYEDGPNLVTMAMSGWGATEPAWWLNLQAHPEAVVEVADGLHARCSEERVGRGARTAVAALARTGQEPGRIRCATPAGDGGRRLRAAPGAAPTRLSRSDRHPGPSSRIRRRMGRTRRSFSRPAASFERITSASEATSTSTPRIVRWSASRSRSSNPLVPLGTNVRSRRPWAVTRF